MAPGWPTGPPRHRPGLPPLSLLLLMVVMVMVVVVVAVAEADDATPSAQPSTEWEDAEEPESESGVCNLEELCAAVRQRPPSDFSIAELESRVTSLTAQLDSVRRQLDSQPGPVAGRLNTAGQTIRDCSDLPAGASSGVHLVQPGMGRPVPVYCDLDMDGGGWTVFQRRVDLRPRRDFFLDWQAYKWGFGELDAEFWWGLEHLWKMTSLLDRRYELRIDLEDFDGESRHALYQGFQIGAEEDGYRLLAEGYSGTAGDSLSYHINQRFSTKDKDHDGHGVKACAKIFKGAWWYKACFNSNLNGQYLAGETPPKSYGVVWDAWLGINYSLKAAEMKIRPTKKL